MLPSVTTLIISQVRHDVDCCVRSSFFVKPEMKSQWTVLVGYPIISTNVSCYQTCGRQYYLPFSNTAHACTKHMVHITKFNSCCTKLNFISPVLSHGHNRPQLNSLSTRFRESTDAWIWVGSKQNCRNQAATG